jgi:hypothetical protein
MTSNPSSVFMDAFRDLLKKCFPAYWQKKQNEQEMREWIAMGRPPRPPHVVKSGTVKEYAKKFGISTLVETGTYHGEMVAACRKAFRRIYSIELSKELFENARERFASDNGVTLLHGDSADVLPHILAEVKEASLFWLDAHYSGGRTAQGRVLTPIFEELEIILGDTLYSHVVLVDDASDFIGAEGYPTIAELKDFVLARRPGCNLDVRDDII